MPNYDYRCAGCGHQFTKKVAMADRLNVQCPECASTSVEQRYTGFGIMRQNNGPAGKPCAEGCAAGGGPGGFS